MKRPNKMGTVEKLSGKRRRPFAVRIFKGLLPNGKPYRPYVGYFAKQSEANRFLEEYLLDPNIIIDKENSNCTRINRKTYSNLWNARKARKNY